MALYEQSPYTQENIPQLIGMKTNVGGYFFDAILKVDHSSKLKLTSHPVAEGANITDHAYLEPQELTMEIGMSDACTSYILGQFEESYTRSTAAYKVLKQLQEERTPVTVHTRLQTYSNMLIETITVPDDFTTLYGLKATIGLKEILVVTTQTITIPPRASTQSHKTSSTNKGTVQAVSEENTKNPSLINSGFKFLSGG